MTAPLTEKQRVLALGVLAALFPHRRGYVDGPLGFQGVLRQAAYEAASRCALYMSSTRMPQIWPAHDWARVSEYFSERSHLAVRYRYEHVKRTTKEAP